nr:hypothetical protein [Kibdelosporangium sp. MJ126-NF4]CEL20043.1 hypothetical protein [Kibdelosporangium sp. MJ126-NF4]CTQ97267.1 hypothetical protein [Kibdelosporangium sp. MJ126-NF4]
MAYERVREMAELGLPGFAIGFVAGTVAGLMALVVGQPWSWAVIAAATLAIPLGLLGGTYSVLIALGKVRIGGFAPVCLFWLLAFPLARLLQEVLTWLILTGKPELPPKIAGFLALQAMISAGFAIGYLWLHERIAPQWWRKVSEHNPLAQRIYETYASHARSMWEAREARRARNRRTPSRR